jgi:hypothetical protein
MLNIKSICSIRHLFKHLQGKFGGGVKVQQKLILEATDKLSKISTLSRIRTSREQSALLRKS